MSEQRYAATYTGELYGVWDNTEQSMICNGCIRPDAYQIAAALNAAEENGQREALLKRAAKLIREPSSESEGVDDSDGGIELYKCCWWCGSISAHDDDCEAKEWLTEYQQLTKGESDG